MTTDPTTNINEKIELKKTLEFRNQEKDKWKQKKLGQEISRN